jgi:phage terminase large subunit-like protein
MSLTKQEELELLLLMQVDEADRLSRYNKGDKIHKKQLEFHRSQHRNRWLFGGNRTGKTVGGAVEAVWMALGIHPWKKVPVPNRGWVVSLTNEVQRDVAQREFLYWMPKHRVKNITVRAGRKDDPENAIIDTIVLDNGSVVGFKSCDQGREKFQGTSQHWIWFDEEPPRPIYDECKMRVIDTRGWIWGTMTPLLGLTWVYEVIYENEIGDPNVRYWMMEWADNPFLSTEEIAELEASMTEDEREARQYGRFVAMSGLVYKEFREDIHVIDPFDVPVEWYDNISIDPGLDAPLSCHWYACDGDGNVYVIAEHYQAGQSVEWHSKRIKEISASMNWPKRAGGMLSALIDSAASAKTLAAEKSVVDLFRDHQIVCNTNVDKSVWPGIQRVKQYLMLREHYNKKVWPKGKPKLFIFRNCTMIIKEIKAYRWKVATASNANPDEPIKRNDHAMDELRYYIMSKPRLTDVLPFLPGEAGRSPHFDFTTEQGRDEYEDLEDENVSFWN